MTETRIAKLFKNGASQAIRLPIEFRFEGDEVYIKRDDTAGDVVLSNRPSAKTWKEFFELLHAVNVTGRLHGCRCGTGHQQQPPLRANRSASGLA